ncbi:MAG: hypothetical protein HC800_12015 [Phormidesmis sp. RL_2_1]|nr:hypothetical protein [Phormidesmis sp. RL_2_1]
MNQVSFAELITTILSVQPSRGQKLAQRLYLEDSAATTVGTTSSVLRRLSRESIQSAGLTEKQAAKLMAALTLGKLAYVPESDAQRGVTVIDNPAIAASLLMPKLAYREKEHAAIVVMNVRHQWLATEVISIGTKSECLFHPDEVFKAALKHDGKRIIIAHNHPSGDLSPSPEDIELTRHMIRGGYLLNMPVIDHLIIGNGDFGSIRESTGIWEELEQGKKTY